MPKPNAFVDALLTKLNAKNDAALCKLLKLSAPHISKLRHGRTSLTPFVVLAIHENGGLPVKEIREIAAERA